MLINPKAIGFIVDPVALINVTIYMDEFAMTMSSIVFPFAMVTSTV
jgi:hypothetical protein